VSATNIVVVTMVAHRTPAGVATPRARSPVARATATSTAEQPWTATAPACPKYAERVHQTTPSQTASSPQTAIVRAAVRQASERGSVSTIEAAGSS